MQRLLNNLLTVAVIGLVSTSASLVMAHGGGGGGGHSSGGGAHGGSGAHSSSHGSSSHGSSSHSSSHTKSSHISHDSHKHSTGPKNNHKTTKSVVHTPRHHPGHPVGHHPRWHYHLHYPVGFWFGGNYDVADADVVEGGIDVEFTKIEQLDAGDPAKNLAPAYRVWFHNNSDVDIAQPFDVAILASNDDQLAQGLPYTSVRVDSLAADETTSADIRLPIAAMTMGTADGQPAPFAYVHTIIDSQKELVETNKANNLSVDSCDNIPAATEE